MEGFKLNPLARLGAIYASFAARLRANIANARRTKLLLDTQNLTAYADRAAMVRMLGKPANAYCFNVVAGLAGDPCPEVRLAVVQSIRQSDDTAQVFPVLMRLASDPAHRVAWMAREALIEVTSSAHPETLREMERSGHGLSHGSPGWCHSVAAHLRSAAYRPTCELSAKRKLHTAAEVIDTVVSHQSTDAMIVFPANAVPVTWRKTRQYAA